MILANINSAVVTRTRKDGKIIGQRMAFDGQVSASELRAELKAAGIKGRELTKRVNEALTGSKDVRWVKHEALVSAARSAGFIPDYADTASNGKSMSVRYVNPASKGVDATAAALAQKERELAALQEQNAAILKHLAAMGITPEQLAQVPALS